MKRLASLLPSPRPNRGPWVAPSALLTTALLSWVLPVAGQGNPDGGGTTQKLKFECGMAVATCFSRGAVFDDGGSASCTVRTSVPQGFVVGIMDLRDPAGNGAVPLSNWLPPMTHNEFGAPQDQWRASNLGEVFGICLDQQTPPNIYVAATSIYPGDSYPSTGGPGTVYRLDGSTYQISQLIQFKDVGSVALGNLCYDPVHNQIFVADLDHGWIRRVSMAGVELSKYDHGVAGRGSVSLPVIPDVSQPSELTGPGRRVFAVQYHGNRVYYSVWDTVTSTSPGPGANTVWSIGLQSNGDFATGPGSARLELSNAQLPWDPTQHPGLTPNPAFQASVITDIAFSGDGKMITAERGLCFQDLRNLNTFAHFSPAREFKPSGTSWVETTAPNGMLVGNSNPGHNSEGGIDYDCDNHVYVTGDLYVVPPLYIYGVEILGNATNAFNTTYLVDLDGSTTFYDKSYLGDIEVYRCCDCLTFSQENLQCTGAGGQYTWSFCVTNTGTLTNGHLVLLDLPPGVTASSPIINLDPPLAPGQGTCTSVTFTMDPKLATNNLCFRIAAHTPDFNECCVVSKCLAVPDCCVLIPRERVLCDAATGGVTWNLTLQNLSGVPASYAIVVPEPPGCVSVPNPVILLNPPLPSGGSTNLLIPLSVTNSPCDRACFRVSLHDAKFVACCSITHCVSLECKQGNHPPVLDCPPPRVEICDPNGGKGLTGHAGVSDPDGDPLTAVWKVNGTPVATNTIPAGLSSTPSAISFTHDFPPGSYTLTLCVSDGNGPPVLCTTTLLIGDQTPPTLQCPPDLTVEAWQYVLPDMTGEVIVSDHCTPAGAIHITQEPPAGTILFAGKNCIRFTATDGAGNTAQCITCITVVPIQVTGLATGFVALPPPAPARFELGVTGDLSNTSEVEYFANDASLGFGAGAGFALPWGDVPEGTYEVFAEALHKGPPGVRYRSASVFVQVGPVSPGGGTPSPIRLASELRNGKLVVTIPTNPGQRCYIESAQTLSQQSWEVIDTSVGDGEIHSITVDPTAALQFIRVRLE
ncbi:MAG TPA: hypothetical protein DCM86_09765 [Verrucomicrobiales bacterium]|nr:hypothetical protein [Verrucomicrobiales bacterium]